MILLFHTHLIISRYYEEMEIETVCNTKLASAVKLHVI